MNKTSIIQTMSSLGTFSAQTGYHLNEKAIKELKENLPQAFLLLMIA